MKNKSQSPKGPKRVPEVAWRWHGVAAHFICGRDCRFHMATEIGEHIVSTVGELWSCRGVHEIHAKIYDPTWHHANNHLKGDEYDAAYMERFGYETVGCDRKYETMVFKLSGERCGCGCGLPTIIPEELDFIGSNDAKTATAGHIKLCKKWALRSIRRKSVRPTTKQGGGK